MRSSSMIFAVLLSSITLSAQTPGNTPAILVPAPFAHACPVLFSVERIPDGAIIRTNLTGPPIPRRQGLAFTFRRPPAISAPGTANTPAAQIVAADVTVHFYPASVRAIPAASSAKEQSDQPQTFHLSNTGSPIQHSSIWTAYTAPASWVELTHVEFADGTVWQPSTPRQCSAAPSLFVLVDQAP